MKKTSYELTAFANQTTMHGIPKIILAKSLFSRIMWSVFCLTAIVMLVYQLTDVLTKYFSYPKKVTIEVAPISVPFPAISLCNMRNLDFHVLNRINKKFIDSKGEPVPNINTTDRFISEYMKYVARYARLWYKVRRNYANEFHEVHSRTSLSSNIPEEIISTAAIQLQELVVSCLFAGNDCNLTTDFTRFFGPYYFNCYTYSLSNDDAIRHRTLSEGIENGWSAILFSGSGILEKNKDIRTIPGVYESRSPLSASDGVRVVVHPPGTKPFPLSEGYDMPPGHSVSLGIRPRKNIRVGHPHGQCMESCSANKGYRMIDCTKKCLQNHVIRSCDCYDTSLPKLVDMPDIKPCRLDMFMPDSCIFNASELCLDAFLKLIDCIRCVRSATEYFTRNTTLIEKCLCHPPCNEVIYDVSYSLSKWPAPGYEGDAAFLDIFLNAKFYRSFLKKETVWEYFKVENRENAIKDFARLNVYIADSNVIVTEESPDYELSLLLSDIGGQLGLWIGISIVTIVELPELLWLTITHCASLRKSGMEQNGTKSTDDEMGEVQLPPPLNESVAS